MTSFLSHFTSFYSRSFLVAIPVHVIALNVIAYKRADETRNDSHKRDTRAEKITRGFLNGVTTSIHGVAMASVWPVTATMIALCEAEKRWPESFPPWHGGKR